MNTSTSVTRLFGGLLTIGVAATAAGQVPASPLEIKSIAEVEARVPVSNARQGSAGAVKLVPATQVEPGDRVIYTLEVHNTGATALDAPTISYPVPEHMRYIADSAVGPGAEVSYSADGGHSFERPENLKVPGVDGGLRAAVAADYTDIRWQLKNRLKANSVAFVRFRALVK